MNLTNKLKEDNNIRPNRFRETTKDLLIGAGILGFMTYVMVLHELDYVKNGIYHRLNIDHVHSYRLLIPETKRQSPGHLTDPNLDERRNIWSLF